MGILSKLSRLIGARRAAPTSPDYQARLAEEQAIFKDNVDVNALPQIFHYWSHHYVRPMLEEAGVSNPYQFFAKYLAESAARAGGARAKFVSLGAGNCDTEVHVAELLRAGGLEDFTIECIDINEHMLERGRALAEARGLAAHVIPLRADFNAWAPRREYAGVMANQSLHHMVALEAVFDAVRGALLPGATFVVNDMIGRNGHQRWPEALEAVHRYWHELPDAYRYNHQLQRHEALYENWDCSNEGFEGIRAQDILPLLLERFEFEVFIAFGNVVDVFIDRGFGHNFDGDGAWDRAFVDRLHAHDEAGLRDGSLSPTHLIGVLTPGVAQKPLCSRGLQPARCVRR